MLKVGRVAKVDARRATAVVVFGADDGLASWTLPVLQHKAHGDQSYWMPDLGDLVVCMLDEHAEFGVVLGAIYTTEAAPPVASLDKLHIRFQDGSTFEYDRAAHRLAVSLTAGGTILLEATHVQVGGDSGGQLVTKAYVDERFDLHVHPGLGTPPTPVAPSATWFTQRTTAE